MIQKLPKLKEILSLKKQLMMLKFKQRYSILAINMLLWSCRTLSTGLATVRLICLVVGGRCSLVGIHKTTLGNWVGTRYNLQMFNLSISKIMRSR